MTQKERQIARLGKDIQSWTNRIDAELERAKARHAAIDAESKLKIEQYQSAKVPLEQALAQLQGATKA